FLLYVWGASYLAQFISHASLSALNTTMTSLPIGKDEPSLRNYLISTSAASQFFCECLEIMIATERILSSIHPAEYHLAGRNNRLLIPLTLLALSGAIFQAGLSMVILRAQKMGNIQVKEAYELAVSMQRAYLITFVSKNLVDSIIMVGCIRGDEAHRCIPLLFPIPFSVVEKSTRVQDTFEPPGFKADGQVYFDELRRTWN
ncbi:hypothetical protein PMAYCL1PPCAC_31464, partial [Pristionchus mayeri]